MRFFRKLYVKLWLAFHRPVVPSLYDQMVEEGGLTDECIPIGLISIVYYMDGAGNPIVSFQPEDTEGKQLDLFSTYAMLHFALDTARDVAAGEA